MSEINRFRWRIFVGSALASIVCAFSLYKIVAEPPVFFTTHSPSGVYTVNLSGQKERPVWFTVEVFAEVLKERKPFWGNQRIHSGDAMDLSFELGWPDHRWIGENVLQFYRKGNFEKFHGIQKVVLASNANETVHHLVVRSSNDKFFVFDLQPGFEITLIATPAKGDFADFYVEGRFYDGRDLKNSAVFDVKGTETSPEYFIGITNDSVEIERGTPMKQSLTRKPAAQNLQDDQTFVNIENLLISSRIGR